jgi:hypothetical protein
MNPHRCTRCPERARIAIVLDAQGERMGKRKGKVLGWHFLASSGLMAHTGTVQVEAGHTYSVEPPIICCERGLHASRSALDALQYAPGAIACRVECSGEIAEQADKIAAQNRRVLWMADADRTLRLFAIWCAEQAVLTVEKLDGLTETDRKALAAARECNRVNRLHLHGKATSAERDAAWAAAGDAAWAAAWAAAGAAAGAAAWKKQARKLESMLMELAPSTRTRARKMTP